jgi:hypothetical protein
MESAGAPNWAAAMIPVKPQARPRPKRIGKNQIANPDPKPTLIMHPREQHGLVRRPNLETNVRTEEGREEDEGSNI